MPSLDEEIEDTNSSNVSDLDVQQSEDTAKPAEASAAADASSSAATGEEDKSLLDVVRDVVAQGAKSDPASPAEGEEDGEKESDDEKAKKQDDDNYEDVPFHKHPRFQHLLRKAKTFEQDAVRYQNVQGFLDQNGITAEEAGDALVTAALAKTNPAECWRVIKPWVQNLLIAAGEVLPDDLQQRVQAGELTHEAALEVSRSKATVQSMQAAQSFREQQEARRQAQQTASSLEQEAASWEAERRERDPNFAAKAEPLMREVAWLQRREGVPKTPKDVRDQLQRAYAAVNAAFAPPQQSQPQQRRTIKPVTGGNVAGNVRPTEMSTLDIVRARGVV